MSTGKELIEKIGRLALDVEGMETESDLLDVDELLNELVIHPECDSRTRIWAERLLEGIGNRLDRGEYL